MSNPYDTQVGGSHYKDMKIQPSEFINKNKLQFAEGNAIKYICRHGSKGQKQDLEKAKHYIPERRRQNRTSEIVFCL